MHAAHILKAASDFAKFLPHATSASIHCSRIKRLATVRWCQEAEVAQLQGNVAEPSPRRIFLQKHRLQYVAAYRRASAVIFKTKSEAA